jgi:2-oxoisovalerate dehydrogenase E2 component (dihydrolipoyl transacylase)
MPQMGISVTEGTILEWRKQPGDRVEADETICEISSDKIDSEIPAPTSGRIVELLVEVGDTVDVGTVIATMAARAPSKAGEGVAAGEHVAAANDVADAAAAAVAPAPVGRSRDGERHSPVVVRLAGELGVALDQVVGTGRDGRVRREDVLAASPRQPVVEGSP